MKQIPHFPRNSKTKEQKRKIYTVIKKYSEDMGYKLLSKEYINSITAMTWESKDGLIIKTRIGNIKNQGFPTNKTYIAARRKTKEDHLNELRKIAETRGGKILSQEYIHGKSKVICEDNVGNIFKMTPYDIKNGHWSPYNKCITEHLCRQILEGYFNVKFPQTMRVIKFKDSNNTKLQLDGYAENVVLKNKVFNIAFEYQGFHTHTADAKTKKYDKYKVTYCKNNNIKLLVIDKINFKINDEYKLNIYIYKTIKNILGKYAPDFKFIKLNFKIISHNLERLNYWREAGKKDGYELLSDQYINATEPLKWKSPSGEIFKRSPQTICGIHKWPTFSNQSIGHLKTKEDFYHLILEFGRNDGYVLLSNEYHNTQSPLKWRSPANIIFNRSWATIKKDGWPTFSSVSMGMLRRKK
jgi:hypothetical protein